MGFYAFVDRIVKRRGNDFMTDLNLGCYKAF